MNDERLVVYIPAQDRAALTRLAKRKGISLGALVRKALKGAIKRGQAREGS